MINVVKTLTIFLDSGVLHRFTVPSLYFCCGAFEYCCDENCCENFDRFYRLWHFTLVLLYPQLYFSCGAFEYCCDEKCFENFDQFYRLWRFTQVLLYPHFISDVVPLSIVVMRNVVKTLTGFIDSGILHRFYCTLTLFQMWCL